MLRLRAGGTPGGGGGGGEYAKEAAVAVTPGQRYAFTVGAYGNGAGYLPGYGTVQQRNGNPSTFAGNSVTVTAHGGLTGLLGGTTPGAAAPAAPMPRIFPGARAARPPAEGVVAVADPVARLPMATPAGTPRATQAVPGLPR